MRRGLYLGISLAVAVLACLGVAARLTHAPVAMGAATAAVAPAAALHTATTTAAVQGSRLTTGPLGAVCPPGSVRCDPLVPPHGSAPVTWAEAIVVLGLAVFLHESRPRRHSPSVVADLAAGVRSSVLRPPRPLLITL